MLLSAAYFITHLFVVVWSPEALWQADREHLSYQWEVKKGVLLIEAHSSVWQLAVNVICNQKSSIIQSWNIF